MNDNMSESTYQTNGNRVYGQGKSYTCKNIATAKELCITLNTYHAAYIRQKEVETKIDKIQKTIIQLQLTNGILTEELKKLHEEIQ